MSPKYKQLRERAGVSRARAAVAADVCEPTARLFEVGGEEAIKDLDMRERLVRVYSAFGQHFTAKATRVGVAS